MAKVESVLDAELLHMRLLEVDDEHVIACHSTVRKTQKI